MFTRFLFKPHESIKVILAILLSVIIIASSSLPRSGAKPPSSPTEV